MSEKATPKDDATHPGRPRPAAAPRPSRAPSSDAGPAKPSRIVSNRTVVFQRRGEAAASLVCRFERPSEGVTGNPVMADVEIGQSWVPLPEAMLGKMSRVGVVVLQNKEGKFWTRPSPEEAADVMSRVVEVGFGDAPVGDLLVSPQQDVQFEPGDVARIRLRSRQAQGTSWVTVTLFPG